MLIIVEGPDGTGKTTLCQRIAEFVGDPNRRLKAGPPRRHPLDEYVMPLLDYHPTRTARHSEVVICDRWHLGELVYPAVLDRPTKMSTTVLSYIEMFLASRGAIIVHVTDDADVLEDVLTARGDDLVQPEQAKFMLELFADAAHDSTLPVIEIEARDSSADTIESILSLAHQEQLRATNISKLVTYVGPQAPKLLLVGDVRGGNPFTHGRKPAFMPYPGSCGDYLLRAVAASYGPWERVDRMAEIGIINANDVDNLLAAWHAFGRPPVVPLGINAARAVADCGISPVRYAPHPQYQKRFRYADYEEYGNMITGSRKP